MKTLLDEEKAEMFLELFVTADGKYIFFVNWSKRGVARWLDEQNSAITEKRLCSVFGNALVKPHETSSSQMAKLGAKNSTDLDFNINLHLPNWMTLWIKNHYPGS